MTSYTLKIKRKALNNLQRLPQYLKPPIEDALKILQTKPIPARIYDIKKMHGTENTYRIRIGDIRIVYTIMRPQKEIIIHFICPRGKAYK